MMTELQIVLLQHFTIKMQEGVVAKLYLRQDCRLLQAGAHEVFPAQAQGVLNRRLILKRF